MSAHYELTHAANGQFFFRLKAANGEIILVGETYISRDAALRGIESVKRNSAEESQYDRRLTTLSEPYFVLKAKNNEIIGRSEAYSSSGAREKGIESVKRNGPDATLKDLT